MTSIIENGGDPKSGALALMCYKPVQFKLGMFVFLKKVDPSIDSELNTRESIHIKTEKIDVQTRFKKPFFLIQGITKLRYLIKKSVS